MARIPNPGLDYSAIDTDYSQKNYGLKVRRKYGLIGHVILFEVICWINDTKGCYAEYDEDTAAAFAMTRLGSLEYAEKVEEVFKYMLEIGFFSIEAFNTDRVLTSEGIVRRWAMAKRRPEAYELPESVKRFMPAAEPDADSPNRNKGAESGITAAVIPQNTPKRTEIAPESHKVKESKVIKQTNNQTSAENSAEIPQAVSEPPDQPPGPARTWQESAAEARGREDWNHARDHAKEFLFFRGISADLIDAAAVCLVHGWLGTAGLRNIRRKARDALDVHDRTSGRRGKSRGWETVRDCISLVIREQKLEPPAYSKKNPELPPVKP